MHATLAFAVCADSLVEATLPPLKVRRSCRVQSKPYAMVFLTFYFIQAFCPAKSLYTGSLVGETLVLQLLQCFLAAQVPGEVYPVDLKVIRDATVCDASHSVDGAVGLYFTQLVSILQ